MNTKPILLTLALALVLSCSRNNYYEHQLLSTLPTSNKQQPIDVFFENEGGPQKDYIEFYDLRVVRRGNFNDRQMVQFLRQEAAKKGLDAIADMKTHQVTEESSTFMDVLATITDPEGPEYTTDLFFTIIEGKGVRYIENIDLTRSVKTGKIYRQSDNAFMGEINYLPNGRIEQTVGENDKAAFMLDTYFKLSEDHLLHEQKDWQTLHYPDGRIDVRRKYRMNDWLLERVRVRYVTDNYQHRIRAIRLTETPGDNQLITRINYKYDENGRLTERKTTGAIAGFKESISYEKGRMSERTIEFAGITYVVKPEYYKQEDLKDLIKKVEETE